MERKRGPVLLGRGLSLRKLIRAIMRWPKNRGCGEP